MYLFGFVAFMIASVQNKVPKQSGRISLLQSMGSNGELSATAMQQAVLDGKFALFH